MEKKIILIIILIGKWLQPVEGMENGKQGF
ncbi:hypothetical protein SAMN06265171_105235 [Chryseobacterium rhizoplanae]|uniref:Uncharacterized protein n=1 Tax=Chryseobacterium rhizoplanae TaxID=1609531 RepID=A0A521DLF7_9FLAO|nr:hypothetical protein SAMN06265171_105235 [Chryseobacterium rhizoplanae]